jgi:hypothetical protein
MPRISGSPSGSGNDCHLAPSGEPRCRSRSQAIAGHGTVWQACLAEPEPASWRQGWGDIQALERRIALKQRDGEVDVVILVVADTRHNRRVLDLHRDALRPLLPLESRQVLASMRNGRLPDRSGIVLL